MYLLIRSAKDKSANERMLDMVSKKPFNIRLKKDFVLSKLVAIESDLAKPNLALNDTDRTKLADDISIIFHVAASVKFEAPLEVNMCHNVVATKSLLDLACSFKQLKCFVHVSTAYSNCQLRQIDERIYPMEVPSDPMTLKVTSEMIDNRPNTYTYTKAMAENVASSYAAKMNILIVRPSIVMSAMREPAEGWIDTINGPVGLSVLGALGILQKIKVNSEVVFDLIPVDLVANALVSIAWAGTEKRDEFLPGNSPVTILNKTNNASPSIKLAANHQISETNNNNHCTSLKSFLPTATKSRTVPVKFSEDNSDSAAAATAAASNSLDGTVRVFNLTTGSENPCSFYQYFSTGREEALKKPSARALRPLLKIPEQKGMNPTLYWIHTIFSHLLFAYIIDTLISLFGHKKMVIKAVNRMHHANEVFDYFCSNQWQFVTDNVKKLRDLQSAEDRETFNSDVRSIDWKFYAEVGWLGCRRYILKEEDDSIEYARQRYTKVCFAYYSVKFLLALVTTVIVVTYTSSPLLTSMLLVPTYGALCFIH